MSEQVPDNGEITGKDRPRSYSFVRGQRDDSFREALSKKSRLSIKDMMHYQPRESNGTTVAGYSGVWLDTDEQPYVRQFKVGPEWKQLDCGWIGKCSELFLRNDVEPLPPLPTAEQLSGENTNTVEIGILTPITDQDLQQRTMFSQPVPDQTPTVIAPVHPNRSARYKPYDLKQLYVRSRGGTVKVTLYLFPE